MLTREEIKDWIKTNGLSKDGTKLVPKTEARINKNSNVVESLLFHTSFVNVDSLCERMYYIIKDMYTPKVCKVCETPINLIKPVIYCSQKCVNSDPDMTEQRQNTYFEKTGYTNPSHNPEVKLKISTSNKKNSENALIVRRKTNFEKYGVEYLFQDDIFKQKAKNTILTRYGVSNVFLRKDIQELCQERKKCTSVEKKQESKLKVKIKRFKNDYNKGYYTCPDTIRLFTEDDWNLDITERKYLCTVCNKEFFRYSSNTFRCIHCNPINVNVTETEVFTFISTLYRDEIKRNDKTQIYPKELDIFLPAKKLAVEFDGLLYHSYGTGDGYSWSILKNLDKENVRYHLDKTEQCESKNISLLHIFENEWVDKTKQSIWKSIIQSKLGINQTIYARKCEIRYVENNIVNEFLHNNHLQGKSVASVKLGLYYQDELVSLLTCAKPRFNKNYDWEITRYCNKINTNVVGGFSKLLKYFRSNHVGTIITYADKRYSNGNMYRVNGFEEQQDSKPNYWYCLPRKYTLYSRLDFQKHKLKDKLEKFDENLTESENMFTNGYRRIWDCGNKVFTLK